MEYIFILGNAGKLCAVELEQVLKSEKIFYKILSSTEQIFIINTNCELDAPGLLKILGGTVKIAKIFQHLSSKKYLTSEISSLLKKIAAAKIIFGLSWHDKETHNHSNDIYQYSGEIKKKLEEQKFSARYVLPKENNELSSVVITKQKIKEIIIYQDGALFVLAETLGVQNFADWNKRDYQRPIAAPDKGMLPPKVARMMINIARGFYFNSNNKELTLLDPFCGMGTILAEALLLDIRVIAVDKDQKAIDGSKKNLEWLCLNYNLENKWETILADATHLSEKLERNTIDLIVTEPYLGPLIESDNRKQITVNNELITKEGKIVTPGYIERIIDGLERLYTGCLKDWSKILTKDGIAVIILPSYLFNNREFFVKKVVDNCEKLGYSIEVGPLPYSRPLAIVKRNIYILRKNSAN